MTNKKWPNDYPDDLVIPPESAEEINARLYRFVNKEIPNADDFLASYKDPEQKDVLRTRNPKIIEKPLFYATSFFGTKDSLLHIKKENPEKFNRKFVVVGSVETEHGKGQWSMHSQHVSFWFYDGVYPEGFELV